MKDILEKIYKINNKSFIFLSFIIIMVLCISFSFGEITDELMIYYELEDNTDFYRIYDLAETSMNYKPAFIHDGGNFTRTSTSYLINESDFGINGGSVTVNMWVKPTILPSVNSNGFCSHAEAQNLFALPITSSDNEYVMCLLREGGVQKVAVQRLKELLLNDKVSYAYTLPLDSYTMLTYRYNVSSTNLKLYINGTEVATRTSTGAGSSGITLDAFMIGIAYGGASFGAAPGTNTADAIIDEVGVWNRTLSVTEIENLYSNYTLGIRPVIQYNLSDPFLYFPYDSDYEENKSKVGISCSNCAAISSISHVGNGSALFDGINDVFDLTPVVTWTNTNFTMSVWLNFSDPSTADQCFVGDDANTDDQAYFGIPGMGYEGSGGGGHVQAAITKTSTWQMYTWVIRSNNTCELWKNNTFLKAGACADSFSFANIGDCHTVHYYMEGHMDNILIYNASLGAPEINSLWNAGAGFIPAGPAPPGDDPSTESNLTTTTLSWPTLSWDVNVSLSGTWADVPLCSIIDNVSWVSCVPATASINLTNSSVFTCTANEVNTGDVEVYAQCNSTLSPYVNSTAYNYSITADSNPQLITNLTTTYDLFNLENISINITGYNWTEQPDTCWWVVNDTGLTCVDIGLESDGSYQYSNLTTCTPDYLQEKDYLLQVFCNGTLYTNISSSQYTINIDADSNPVITTNTTEEFFDYNLTGFNLSIFGYRWIDAPSCLLNLNDTGLTCSPVTLSAANGNRPVDNISEENYCYQETANVSTACGGLATGTYASNGSWSFANVNVFWDTNWSSFTQADGESNIYINYTIPVKALSSSLWEAKGGGTSAGTTVRKNLTINSSCWEEFKTTNIAQFRLFVSDTPGAFNNYYCKNTTDWVFLDQFGAKGSAPTSAGNVYEEAMWWDMAANYTLEGNMTCISDYVQEKDYLVNVSCNYSMYTNINSTTFVLNLDADSNPTVNTNLSTTESNNFTTRFFDFIIRGYNWTEQPVCAGIFNSSDVVCPGISLNSTGLETGETYNGTITCELLTTTDLDYNLTINCNSTNYINYNSTSYLLHINKNITAEVSTNLTTTPINWTTNNNLIWSVNINITPFWDEQPVCQIIDNVSWLNCTPSSILLTASNQTNFNCTAYERNTGDVEVYAQCNSTLNPYVNSTSVVKSIIADSIPNIVTNLTGEPTMIDYNLSGFLVNTTGINWTEQSTCALIINDTGLTCSQFILPASDSNTTNCTPDYVQTKDYNVSVNCNGSLYLNINSTDSYKISVDADSNPDQTTNLSGTVNDFLLEGFDLLVIESNWVENASCGLIFNDTGVTCNTTEIDASQNGVISCTPDYVQTKDYNVSVNCNGTLYPNINSSTNSTFTLDADSNPDQTTNLSGTINNFLLEGFDVLVTETNWVEGATCAILWNDSGVTCNSTLINDSENGVISCIPDYIQTKDYSINVNCNGSLYPNINSSANDTFTLDAYSNPDQTTNLSGTVNDFLLEGFDVLVTEINWVEGATCAILWNDSGVTCNSTLINDGENGVINCTPDYSQTKDYSVNVNCNGSLYPNINSSSNDTFTLDTNSNPDIITNISRSYNNIVTDSFDVNILGLNWFETPTCALVWNDSGVTCDGIVLNATGNVTGATYSGNLTCNPDYQQIKTYNVSANCNSSLYPNINSTTSYLLTLNDTIPPYFTNSSDNSTSFSPSIGDEIQLNLTINDVYNVSTCRLMLNDSIGGMWQNRSIFNLDVRFQYNLSMNYTITSNSTGNQSHTGWRVWCNDSVGNANVSDIYTFDVVDTTVPIVVIGDNNGFSLNNHTVVSGARYNMTYNITFSDANLFEAEVNVTCDISGAIYYWKQLDWNSSTLNKNDIINLTGIPLQRCTFFAEAIDDGTNTTNTTYYFFVGGLINVSGINIYDNSTIQDYNLSISSLIAYPGLNQSYNITTHSILIENISNGTYNFLFNRTDFFNLTYVVNVENTTQSINYSAFQASVNIILQDLKTGTILTGANITWLNDNTAYNNIYINTTLKTVFFINASDYALTVDKDTYDQFNENYTIAALTNTSITVLYSPLVTFYLYDEKTLDLFNYTSPDTITFLLICPGETITTIINGTAAPIIPVTCNYTSFRFSLEWSPGATVSGETIYFRSFLIDLTESLAQDIYLIDLADTEEVTNNLILDDLLQDYDSPSIFVNKNIGDTAVQITAAFTDIENKIVATLIKNDEYIVEVHSTNNPDRIMGSYIAHSGDDKTLRLYDIDLDPTTGTFNGNLTYNLWKTNTSGDVFVRGWVQDLSNITRNSTFTIRETTYNGPILYSASSISNNVTWEYNITAKLNSTIFGRIDVDRPTGPFGDVLYVRIMNEATGLVLGILDYIGTNEEGGNTFFNWFFTIFLGVLAIMATIRTANYVSIALVGMASLFVAFGWFGISTGILALAILISLAGLLKAGDKGVVQ